MEQTKIAAMRMDQITKDEVEKLQFPGSASNGNHTGFVAIDLGSLATGGAMQEVGAPLSGLDLHFVRRLR